ncbi:hypothetical protein N7493_008349 [Penicillium malachiteum]|uniref:Xylanolytic transcriptional activator regulatory domain-containing protein n=1 Tax=Penicillium malachiteum TaxID=1324776 RepID=A0AAD6HH10_9EURO|nr:hypothetical protein N7493_008349 [Penicillium malachiteum]
MVKYSARGAREPYSESPAFPSLSSEDESPRRLQLQRVLKRHLEAFLKYVAPAQANSFLHRATLMQQALHGRAPRALLLSICAISSRFLSSESTETEGSAEAHVWSCEATALLALEGKICWENVVAALVLARHAIASGVYDKAWTLSAMASRQALALGLHRESPGLSWTIREQRRRLMWACFGLDCMMST